ncbi:inositol polyphosphate phosphatase [Schizosaccharomyces cryophilus OY26]|uniref:Inositol polyphosphate phosphatase n=1 Tax=Schizosaccharomyces cryophilus (strain OY26 / ATCC MYA-4695 / CBS 11777 / NBRC 106824 / NRRL Y48691) TaxID=653667 RepID=S9VVA8_SCHCR|nr:inositol polyphosphate phosphatase [Schizosaccharomyces cryophilus OY26]EPY51723.1 inositol polyphosphate phosphatase [Schizosaccharomyces cryophilus OY26]
MNQDVRILPEAIYISSLKKAQCLRIDRSSGALDLSQLEELLEIPPQLSNIQLYGIIRLKLFKYIILITKCEHNNTFLGNNVFRAKSFAILPITKTISAPLEPQTVQDEEERYYLYLLKRHLYHGQILFSPSMDLTNSLQRSRNVSSGCNRKLKPNFRFFWNKYTNEELLSLAMNNTQFLEYIQPVIQGNISSTNLFVKTHHVQLHIITRHATDHSGTRYFSRGVDQNGKVANFNETEQVLLIDSTLVPDERILLSYTQIRGSIPMFWAEINDLRYLPRLVVQPTTYSEAAFERHFQDLASDYQSEILVVSLLDHKGREAMLQKNFKKICTESPKPVKYYEFDYHSQGSKDIPLLLASLKSALSQGSFYSEYGSRVVSQQQKIIRANCMDCLDRTNVVQTEVSLLILNLQLQTVGILSYSETIEDFQEFVQGFRNVWASTGDYISHLYTGTPALKGDVTRNGKRTTKGMYKDFTNCLKRYVYNNFCDGVLQDSFDLGLGAFRPITSFSSSIMFHRTSWAHYIPPTYSVVSIIWLIMQGLMGTGSLLFQLSLGIPALFSFLYVILHRKSYINWPRLLPPKYASTGWFSIRHLLRSWSTKVFRFLRFGSFKKKITRKNLRVFPRSRGPKVPSH